MNRIESNCLRINILNGDKAILVLCFHRFGLFMESRSDSETYDLRLYFNSQLHRGVFFFFFFAQITLRCAISRVLSSQCLWSNLGCVDLANRPKEQ